MSRRKVNAKLNAKADSSPKNSIKASPNAVHEVERLQQLFEAEKEKGRIRDETISLLKDDKTYLQRELVKKDELIHQLLSKKDEDNSTTKSGKSTVKRKHWNDRRLPLKKAKQLKSIDINEDEEDSSSILSDSSEESSIGSHPMKKSSKSPPSSSSSRHQVKPSSTDDLIGRTRARNTRSIIARYKMAVDAFNRGGSMKAAFDCIGADRNTVSRTAPIAELSIAAPDIFKNVGPWNDRKEKLSSFIDRCRAAMTPEVKENIQKMKDDGDLLPIATHI